MAEGLNGFSIGQSIGERVAGPECREICAAIRRMRDWNFIQVPMAATQPQPQPFVPMRIKTPFNPDELVNIFRSIVRQSLGEGADLDLLKSMMPREVPATKTGPHTSTIETAWIIDRIKWRVKMAERFGLSLEVFRDERMDVNSKADDLAILQAFRTDVVPQQIREGSGDTGLSDLKQGQTEIIGRLENIQYDVSDSAEVGRQTNTLVQAFVPPRPSDYECSEKNLEQILTRLNVKRTVRQIRRWEDYIRTSGEEGTQPPSGYTLQTRLTLASATAWAETFATKEKAKLRTKTYLNEATATRDGTPAKRT